jgi:hypothetical protein
LLAVLRHNENANGSKPVGSVPPSCSPPASVRPRWPASSASPARASISGTSAGCSAIPKATKPARIAENFDVDFELTSEQLAALDTGKCGGPEPETETETITLEGCGMPITEA